MQDYLMKYGLDNPIQDQIKSIFIQIGKGTLMKIANYEMNSNPLFSEKEKQVFANLFN